MIKHIIMLTLCFMVYNIGNIDALNAAERKAQFELAVQCYRQMFENGLIYKDEYYSISIYYNIMSREFLPTVDNKQFESDKSFASFRKVFIDHFVQKGNQEDLQNQINALSAKISSGVPFEHPLKEFILNYSPNSNKEYLRTPSAFCTKYSTALLLQTNVKK